MFLIFLKQIKVSDKLRLVIIKPLGGLLVSLIGELFGFKPNN